jgi:hypothetical protein
VWRAQLRCAAVGLRLQPSSAPRARALALLGVRALACRVRATVLSSLRPSPTAAVQATSDLPSLFSHTLFFSCTPPLPTTACCCFVSSSREFSGLLDSEAPRPNVGKAKETTTSANTFGEERTVVIGEKAAGRVVVVAALCHHAITSRRHAVTWRRRLLGSSVVSVAPVSPRLDSKGSTRGFLSGHGVQKNSKPHLSHFFIQVQTKRI